MRLTSICLGNAIDLQRLSNGLSRRNENAEQIELAKNCITQVHTDDAENAKTVFYFDNGSIITWNFNKFEVRELVKKCEKFVSEPLTEIEEDFFSYRYGTETRFEPQGHFNVDIVTLASQDIQLKLAISYALAQSVKLQYFSTTVQKTIDENTHIVEKMRKTGRVWLMSRKLKRTMATVFTIRNRLNLDSEVLHVPEYFWRQSAFESDYIMTHNFLDIEDRVSALNQKIDVLNDMFDMFKSQIEHRHFFTLEVIIVILIFVEIIESLPKLF